MACVSKLQLIKLPILRNEGNGKFILANRDDLPYSLHIVPSGECILGKHLLVLSTRLCAIQKDAASLGKDYRWGTSCIVTRVINRGSICLKILIY